MGPVPNSRQERSCAADVTAARIRAYRLVDDSHGIRPSDIKRVEATWGFADGHHSPAGFVLSLNGGSKVSLSYACEEEEPGMPVVETLIVGQSYPDFDTPYEPLGGWSHETEPFDALLAAARR